MKRAIVPALALLAAASLLAQEGPFIAGRWAGSADLGEGEEPLVVRVIESSYPEPGSSGAAAIALVDLPARGVFGYPTEGFRRDPEGMSFSISTAGAAGGGFSFRGLPTRRGEGSGFAVSGLVLFEPRAEGEEGEGRTVVGDFLLALEPGADRGEPFAIEVEGGSLAGSLVLPASSRGWNVPVALLVAGAGEADRDGNNYNVPGRSDALALLARELGLRGVASLRYDKRGSGESLASAAAPASFDDYVEDASRALRELADDPRFSRVIVVGHAEGALVGAAALARAEGVAPGRLAGLAALCASGLTEGDILRRDLRLSIESGFPELSDEERESVASDAEGIVDALEAGRTIADPRPELSAFFSPAAQAYLASRLRYEPGALVAALPLPLLVVAGGSDLQVGEEETRSLLAARPDAAYRAIEGMSHCLKSVGEDEEANYESFVDPSYPLGEGLAELIAAFARGDSLP